MGVRWLDAPLPPLLPSLLLPLLLTLAVGGAALGVGVPPAWPSCQAEAKDSSCFDGTHFSCTDCCDTVYTGREGNPKCWGKGYTYERCCPACPATHEPACFPPGARRSCQACCDRALGPRGDEACWQQGGGDAAVGAPLSFERCCLGRPPVCTARAADGRRAVALQTSQSGQDHFVLNWLGCPASGFYIDVGAYDGEHLSNTHAMDVNLGWKGVCVDAALARDRFQQRSCLCVHAAVHSETGRRMHFRQYLSPWAHFGEAYGGLREGNGEGGVHPALGEWVDRAVYTATMRDVLRTAEANGFKAPGVIDYVNIDVEGVVPAVLAGFPFESYCVRVWTLEVWDPGGVAKTGRSLELLQVAEVMQSHGYVLVHVLAQDHVFAHRTDCGVSPAALSAT